MKMYVLSKRVYGDFDMPVSTPVYASPNKNILKDKRDEFNTARTDMEIEDGVEYVIEPNSIKVI